MIVRIVKLQFKEEEIEAFKSYFDSISHLIRNFDGCQRLELLQEIHQPSIFFTYSYWNDEQSLENYRNSDLFKSFWTVAKSKFSQKAEAWSHSKIAELH